VPLAVALALATAGCEGGASRSPGEVRVEERTVTIDGLRRSFVVHIPAGLRDLPAPVILAFHGGFGTPESFERTTRLGDVGVRAGFVVVFPRGVGRSWNAGDCCGPAERRDVDDVEFVRVLVKDLGSLVAVDSARIFAIGFSNGGKFAYRLVCAMWGRISAMTSVAGTMSTDQASCRSVKPVSVMHIHGTADRFGPYGGGPSKFRSIEQQSVPATVQFWLRRHRCSSRARVTYAHAKARCRAHSQCDGGVEMQLCTVAGMGHQWPGAAARLERILGPGNDDLDATRLSVEFFLRHPIRSTG
jgi:polyhydroxybutyrate depolymerase